jgi:hypothetical protein
LIRAAASGACIAFEKMEQGIAWPLAGATNKRPELRVLARLEPGGLQSMIRKSGKRFSEKIMLKQEDERRA